jgi:hypothetical protein
VKVVEEGGPPELDSVPCCECEDIRAVMLYHERVRRVGVGDLQRHSVGREDPNGSGKHKYRAGARELDVEADWFEIEGI